MQIVERLASLTPEGAAEPEPEIIIVPAEENDENTEILDDNVLITKKETNWEGE